MDQNIISGIATHKEAGSLKGFKSAVLPHFGQLFANAETGARQSQQHHSVLPFGLFAFTPQWGHFVALSEICLKHVLH